MRFAGFLRGEGASARQRREKLSKRLYSCYSFFSFWPMVKIVQQEVHGDLASLLQVEIDVG